ncbi:MAG TPA: hypothetical protein VK862_17015 [Afifellaceae bacterium]|nr:hypothetical protein [Afifellaceae bacterium]
MCGEIDEQAMVGQDLLEQARVMAGMLGVKVGVAPTDHGPAGLADASGRAAYMDKVFNTGLASALADMNSAAEDEVVDVVASRAIALARLTGFMAGQLPPEADLFRAVIEAVTAGHAEPARLVEAYRKKHDHHHGSDHDHHHHDH